MPTEVPSPTSPADEAPKHAESIMVYILGEFWYIFGIYFGTYCGIYCGIILVYIMALLRQLRQYYGVSYGVIMVLFWYILWYISWNYYISSGSEFDMRLNMDQRGQRPSWILQSLPCHPAVLEHILLSVAAENA